MVNFGGDFVRANIGKKFFKWKLLDMPVFDLANSKGEFIPI
jgi:hypothetical protein